jgi:hypothetical protein
MSHTIFRYRLKKTSQTLIPNNLESAIFYFFNQVMIFLQTYSLRIGSISQIYNS